MMQWNTLLKSLGFTDSEAKIYLLSLELGPSSVQDIAKKAKVSRVTTYAAIEALKKDGLMSSVEKGKKTMYAAETPDRLVSFVHNRMKQMENTLREVEQTINELKLVQRGDKPVVKLFEGKEGLRAIQDDILKTGPDEILEMSNHDALLSAFTSEELSPYSKELDRKKIRTQSIVLFSEPQKGRMHANIHPLLSKDFSFFGNVTIYDSKVALTTFQGNNISVLIESDVLAQTMREMFRLASEGAKHHK